MNDKLTVKGICLNMNKIKKIPKSNMKEQPGCDMSKSLIIQGLASFNCINIFVDTRSHVVVCSRLLFK